MAQQPQGLNVPTQRLRLSKCLVVSVCIEDYASNTPFADRAGADKDIQHIAGMFAGDELYHKDGHVDKAALEGLLTWAQRKLVTEGGKYEGFVLVLSGHGVASKVAPNELSCFVTSDGSMHRVSDILHMYRNGAGALEDSFLGKPRIVVLEACRDAHAVAAAADHEEKVGSLVEKGFNQDDDFLIIRSSAAGTASYRTKAGGSLLIKSVSQVFNGAAVFNLDDALYCVKGAVAKASRAKQAVITSSTMQKKVVVHAEARKQRRFDMRRVKAVPAQDLLDDGLKKIRWDGSTLKFYDDNDNSWPISAFHVSCRSDRFVEGEDMIGVVVYLHKVTSSVTSLESPPKAQGSWTNFWRAPSGIRCRSGYIVLKKSGSNSELAKMSSTTMCPTMHAKCYKKVFGEDMDKSYVIGAGFAYQGGQWLYRSGTFNAQDDQFHVHRVRELSAIEESAVKQAVENNWVSTRTQNHWVKNMNTSTWR